MDYSKIILMAMLAGGFTYLCTTLGSALVFFIKEAKRDQKLYMQLALGFSAGIMLAASIFSLIIPALDASDGVGNQRLVPVVGGFILGVAFLIMLDKCMPHLHVMSHSPEGPKSTLGKHTLLFLAITIHNIPEGMAIAVPLINGGVKRRLAILITALSGAPTIVGALVGFWIGDIGPLGLALSLSFASGAMLYVVFGEILPQSILMYRSKLPAFFVIIGMLLGLVVIHS